MPITTVDPVTALVVVDLQRGIVELPTVRPPAEVVAKAAELAKAFRARGLPVVLVNVDRRPPGRTEQGAGGGGTPMPADATAIVEELEPAPEDVRVTKRSWGAFIDTDLHAQLQARGVTQVVVCGIATSAGVEGTAREAYALGYHVTTVTDASTDREAVVHDHAVERILPRLGETGTTDEVLARLP